MATKKDLVEAYSFSRRRLVTAFVSGAPGGREVEPARPGRVIVGGVALAVLLVAGAAIGGVLKPRSPEDWREHGLVTDDTGALYVILDEEVGGHPRLRSVINVTSAQLILGADTKAESVPSAVIAEEPKGPPIGILGAPATVPAPGQLLNTGWTSCTGTGHGVRTAVAAEPAVEPAGDDAFVVRGARSGELFLIAEAVVPGVPERAYRYRVPERNDALFTALNLSPNDEVEVPDRWLELFPVGGSLDARGLGFAAWATPAQVAGFPGARVGDWFESNGRPFALTREGPVELSPFAAAVLRSTPIGGGLPRTLPAPATLDVAPGVPYAASLWPEDAPAGSVPAFDEVCALLETAEGEEPAVRLAVRPQGDASARDVEQGAREVSVTSGHGAVIRSAGWISETGGTPHLVDDRGISYVLAGDVEVERLGYADVPVLVVPDTWNELFGAGPELSQAAALCPPAPADAGTSAPAPTCA